MAITQRRMDVDILVSGHTHELQLWESDTKIFINPGSATGAYSGFQMYVGEPKGKVTFFSFLASISSLLSHLLHLLTAL